MGRPGARQARPGDDTQRHKLGDEMKSAGALARGGKIFKISGNNHEAQE